MTEDIHKTYKVFLSLAPITFSGRNSMEVILFSPHYRVQVKNTSFPFKHHGVFFNLLMCLSFCLFCSVWLAKHNDKFALFASGHRKLC